jgi:hypothetical protein
LLHNLRVQWGEELLAFERRVEYNGFGKAVHMDELAGFQNLIGIADWQEQLTRELPEDLKSSLPTIEEIERELEG